MIIYKLAVFIIISKNNRIRLTMMRGHCGCDCMVIGLAAGYNYLKLSAISDIKHHTPNFNKYCETCVNKIPSIYSCERQIPVLVSQLCKYERFRSSSSF